MTNYLLSIDPSIKNTGFTLWEKEKLEYCGDEDLCFANDCYCYQNIAEWKPILVTSYNFNKYYEDMGFENIKLLIEKYEDFYHNIDLIIERGTFHSKNGIGYETQEHLRGFIAGQFNKLLTKDMLISPSEWKKWYVNKYVKPYWKINYVGLEEELKYQNEKTKWNKLLSLLTAKYLIEENNWNITISNHDEADSLLIGWYYLNKENK